VSNGVSFARKDKWQQHIQEQHGYETYCPVIHCAKELPESFNGFQSGKEICDHIFNDHIEPFFIFQSYSCNFGGCEAFQSSRFLLTGWQLADHMRIDHGIDNLSTVYAIIQIMEAVGRHSVQLEDLPVSTNWSLCKRCVASHALRMTSSSSSTSAEGCSTSDIMVCPPQLDIGFY
jgi:hypothetical protein